MSALTRRDFVRNGAAGALALWLPNGLIERAAAAGGRRVQPSAFADLRKRLTGTLLLPGDAGYTQTEPSRRTPVSTPSARPPSRNARTRPMSQPASSGRSRTALSRWRAAADTATPETRPRPGCWSTSGGSTASSSTSAPAWPSSGEPHSTRTCSTRRSKATSSCQAALAWASAWVGGLVLGGGVGYNTHWAGLTCDHLRGSRIVTAAGDVLKIDDSHHSDLFWACRGGAGGNFGINTSFTFELARVPRQDVAFYRFDYRGADAAGAVLSAFEKLLRDGTDGPQRGRNVAGDTGRSQAARARRSRRSPGASTSVRSTRSRRSSAHCWRQPSRSRHGLRRCASGTCSACSPAWKHSTMRSATSRATRRLRSPKASSRKWSTCSPPARAAMTPTTARCGRSVGSGETRSIRSAGATPRTYIATCSRCSAQPRYGTRTHPRRSATG